MARIAAVGVDNNLSAGETRIAVRPADHKTAGRVDIKARVLVDQFRRQHLVENILLDVRVNLLLAHVRIMLGREHDSVKARRLSVLIVLDRDLALAVRAEIREFLCLSELCQLAAELVREANRIRHELLRLPAGIAEHEALIARALVQIPLLLALALLERVVHALRDVRRLLVECGQHGAGIAVKAVLASRIADFPDGVAHQLLIVNPRRCRNFSHQHNEAGRRRGLAGHAALRILGEQCVQNRVRNLVANFIRMSLSHGLRSE